MKILSTLSLIAILFAGCNTSKKSIDQPKTTLIGTKWVLVELMGQQVKVSNNKKLYLILQPDNSSVNGNAGCNGFFGTYELDQATQRISFQKIGSTLMACDDLNIENEFKRVLETADNYSFDGTTLSLNKARMAPLARFEAAKE